MGFIYGVLIVFEALLSALLTAIIFMQRTKGGMGGSAFGGGAGEAIFGSRMGNVLTKATVILGSIFLFNTILLTIMTARRGDHSGSVMDRVDAVPAPMQQPAMPASLPESGIPGPAPAPLGLSDGTAIPSEAQPPSMPVEIPAAVPAESPVPIAVPVMPEAVKTAE
jgi:preprotein translocase subunit SecG